MRFEHTSLAKAAKDTKFLEIPTIAYVSESDWKKGKWLSLIPSVLRERVQTAADRLKDPLKAGSRLCIPGANRKEEDFWVALLPERTEMFFILESARDAVKHALHPTSNNLRILLVAGDFTQKAAEAFGAAVSARIFPMPVYGKREKNQKPWKLSRVELATEDKKDLEAFEYGYATAEGTNLARYLATLPPNILNPGEYGKRIRQLCKENGLSYKFHSKEALKKMGAGAFVAVDQGNPDSEGGIYELGYSPKKKGGKTINLVGKGICFDTGGYDVKVGGGMITMKGDMQGSAVALATLVTAARLGLPYEMKAFLAITENHLSPKGFKADEIIYALNGLSIEVTNTDAEGRMVLSDTLTLASREKPDLVLDFATLTGSAVRALGTKIATGYSNREELHEDIRQAGRESGERVWPFPLDPTYYESLESKIADTIQHVRGAGHDHILAACFLSKFVEEGTPWVHVDLTPAENEGGLAHVDSLFTGFGVRWALDFMERV